MIEITTTKERDALIFAIDEVKDRVFTVGNTVEEYVHTTYPYFAKQILSVIGKNSTPHGIEQALAAYQKELAARQVVTLVTAVEVRASVLKKMSTFLSDTPWKHALIAIEVDPTILGGVQIKAIDRFYDYSLSTLV